MQGNAEVINAQEKKEILSYKKMPFKNVVGDGVGQAGLNIFGGFSALLLFYYTDIAGVSAALVGTLFLIARIFDALTNLLMGLVIDRTNSKYGKARPWMLWMSIPTMVTGIALFYIPEIGANGQALYILIVNMLFLGICFTALGNSYNTLMALKTKNPNDRTKMGITRSLFGLFGGMLMSTAFIPIVTALGGKQTDWTLLISIVSVLAVILVLIAFKSGEEIATSTERVKFETSIPIKKQLAILFKNKYLMSIVMISLITSLLLSMTASTGIYFAKYIWEDINLVAIMGAIGFLPMVAGYVVLGPFAVKFGKRNVALVTTIIGIIGSLVRLVDPYNIPLGITSGILAAFAVVPFMAYIEAMLSDTIEYTEWKSQARFEGLTNSFSTFASTVGTGVGTAITGWLLAFGGFVEGQSTQPESAQQMIIALTTYIQAFFLIITLILLWRYKLDKIHPQLMADIEERNTNSK